MLRLQQEGPAHNKILKIVIISKIKNNKHSNVLPFMIIG